MISKRKITAIFMAAVVAVNLAGCSFKSEKRENKEVLEYLENKYDKEFEISQHLERVGAGPFKPEEFKMGKAYCIDNKDENFDVILYDDGLCKDNYQNIIMFSDIEDYYSKMIKKYWNNAELYMELRWGNTSEKYSNGDELEYLINSGVNSILWIYVLEDNIDNNEYIKIQALVNELIELGLVGQVTIGYIKNSINYSEKKTNDEIWEEYESNGCISKYFSKIISQDVEKKLMDVDEVKNKIKDIDS